MGVLSCSPQVSECARLKGVAFFLTPRREKENLLPDRRITGAVVVAKASGVASFQFSPSDLAAEERVGMSPRPSLNGDELGAL